MTNRQAEDALALAARIASGETSAVQVMQQTLARIETLNPKLNAVCLVRAELGLLGAAKVDAQLAACKTDAERAALHAAAFHRRAAAGERPGHRSH